MKFDFRNVGCRHTIEADTLDAALAKLFDPAAYPVRQEERHGKLGWCADLPGGGGECVWHPDTAQGKADTIRVRDSECARRLAVRKDACVCVKGQGDVEIVCWKGDA